MFNVTGNSSTWVQLTGRLDGAGAAIFEKELAAYEAGTTPVVLDCEGVDFLSSAGIRSLMKLEKKLRARGGHLILAGLMPMVKQSLEISGLLSHFDVAANRTEAEQRLRGPGDSAAGDCVLAEGRIVVKARQIIGAASRVVLWPGAGQGAPRLRAATLDELPMAFGLGGFGHDQTQAIESLGNFFTAGQTVALQAEGGLPDYLHADDPQNISFYVAEAVAVEGTPAAALAIDGDPVSFGELAGALPGWMAMLTGDTPSLIAFELQADGPVDDDGTSRRLRALGVLCRLEAKPGSLPADWPSVAPGLVGRIAAIRLDGSDAASEIGSSADPWSCELNHDALAGVMPVDSDFLCSHARIRVYLPAAMVLDDAVRLRIEQTEEGDFPDAWELITRRIYSDSSRVVLTRMTGGYSATTMRAESYDKEGRKTIPTVLKIATRHVTDAEARAYHAHVKNFILNNSTVIMGHAAEGEWAGLRYNFVGVNGPGSSLSWLARIYRDQPVEVIKPLVDTVFGQVLWPWYGQTRREMLQPFAQHAPAPQFFPDIPGDAEGFFGLSADDPFIYCEALERDLPNPYHFLRHEFVRLRSWERRWYSSITHGDLNLNNILVDEKENIYVIDFSETRPRNALSDFARIEPVIFLEYPRLDDEHDMKQLLMFLEGMTSVSPLHGDPLFRYEGDDPMVGKAWNMACQLRQYARQTVHGDDQAVFYWLPLLEWTLPCVSYRQLSPERKRLSMYFAGLICEQVQKLV